MGRPKKVQEKPKEKPKEEEEITRWKVRINRQSRNYDSQDEARKAVISLLETGKIFYLSLENVNPTD